MNRKSEGFSLIEVMIAILIMSLGLLGVASTLLVSLRSASSNYLKQQAVQYTYDITDRMRANAGVAHDPSSANPYITALSAPSATAPSPNCSATACNAAQMAAYDIWQWKSLLQHNLPGGLGQVQITPAGPAANLARIMVTVDWSDEPVQTSFNGTPSASVPTQKLIVVTAL